MIRRILAGVQGVIAGMVALRAAEINSVKLFAVALIIAVSAVILSRP